MANPVTSLWLAPVVVLALSGTADAAPKRVPVSAHSAKPAVAAPAPILRAGPAVPLTTDGDHEKPFLARRAAGGTYLAWAERTAEQTSVLFAVSRDGVRYGPPVRLSTEGMDLDLGAENGPAIAVGPEGRIYVTWVAGSWKVKSEGHAHTPAAGGKKGPPPRPGHLNIFLVSSMDDGKTFSYPIRVNDDPNGPEHRFPTAVTDAKGTLYLTWLDKRKGTPENPGFSRVYVTRSTDGGKTFTPNVDATLGQKYGICHCCRLALVTHPREGLMVAFRNDVNDMRDIFLVRSSDQGATFTAPAPIEDYQWTIPACPFNGPSLAFDPAGNLHLAWMTGGNSAGKPLLGASTGATYKVMYRRMEAGTRKWSAPLCVAEGTHPKLLLTSDGAPVIAWDGDGIQVARLPRNTKGKPELLRLTPPTREYAFPSIIEAGDKSLLVTWQKTDETGKTQLFSSRLTPGNAPGGLTANTPR